MGETSSAAIVKALGRFSSDSGDADIQANLIGQTLAATSSNASFEEFHLKGGVYEVGQKALITEFVAPELWMVSNFRKTLAIPV